MIFDVQRVYREVEDQFDVDKFVAEPDLIVQRTLQNEEFIARLDSTIAFGGVEIHKKDNTPQILANSEDPFMIERNFNAHCSRECNSRQFLAPVDIDGSVDISAISIESIQTIGDLRNLECFSICKLVGCLHDCSEVLKSTNHCLIEKYNQEYFASLIEEYDNCMQSEMTSTTKAPSTLETIQNISSTTDGKADFLTTESSLDKDHSTKSTELTTLPTSRRSWTVSTSGNQSAEASSTTEGASTTTLYKSTEIPNTTDILHDSPTVQQFTTSRADVSTVSPPSTTYFTETTQISSIQITTTDALTTDVLTTESTTESLMATTTSSNESTTIESTSLKNKLKKATATTDSAITTDVTKTLNTMAGNLETTTFEATTDMQAVDDLVVSKSTTTIAESTTASVLTTTTDIISSTPILSTAQSVESSTSSRFGRSVNTTTSENQTTLPVTTEGTTIYSTHETITATTPDQKNETTQTSIVRTTSLESTTSAELTTQPTTSQSTGEFNRVTMSVDLTMEVVGTTSVFE